MTKSDIAWQFGMSLVDAAKKAGHSGMAADLPADDIYAIVVDATLLFAATMSRKRMSKIEFTVQAGMVFDRANSGERAKGLRGE